MIDIEKFDRLYGIRGEIRKEVLSLIEELRQKKTVGKSIECGVIIRYLGRNWRDGFYDSNTVRESLNVSWVELLHAEQDKDFHWYVIVWDLKQDKSFRCCQRCWLYHRDSDVPKDLCRRCAGVMYSCYPDHPALQNQ